MYHHLTAVTMSVAGTQDGAIDASAADRARQNAHIQIQSGLAWVSCYDLQAVACHAAAWHAATDAATALPAGGGAERRTEQDGWQRDRARLRTYPAPGVQRC